MMTEEEKQEVRAKFPRVERASGRAGCVKCREVIRSGEECLVFIDNRYGSKKYAHLWCVGVVMSYD